MFKKIAAAGAITAAMGGVILGSTPAQADDGNGSASKNQLIPVSIPVNACGLLNDPLGLADGLAVAGTSSRSQGGTTCAHMGRTNG